MSIVSPPPQFPALSVFTSSYPDLTSIALPMAQLARHITSTTVTLDRDEELNEITNTIQTPNTTPKPNSRSVKTTVPSSVDGHRGDIRNYFSPSGSKSFPAFIDLTSDFTNVSDAFGNLSPSPAIKRPVGRPRKHPIVPVVDVPAVKRPVGRPRKQPIVPVPATRTDVQPVPARPRGRPRKHHLPGHHVFEVATPVSTPSTFTFKVVTPSTFTSEPEQAPSPAKTISSPIKSRSSVQVRSDQTEVNGLAEALSLAFSHNASQNSGLTHVKTDHTLVTALASAFADNATHTADEQSSPYSSDESDSEEVETIAPLRRSTRRRRITQRVQPQIPSPKKRRTKERSEGVALPASEEVFRQVLNLKKLSVQLPPGVSIAPENDSIYLEPNEGVILDYDSGIEAEEEREKEKKIKTDFLPQIRRHNLRFVLPKPGASARKERTRIPARQYITSASLPTSAFVQRVEDECGKEALSYVSGEVQNWDANIKPKKHYQSRHAEPPSSPNDSDDDNSVASHPEKRLHREEEDEPPRKRVRFSDSVDDDSSAVQLDNLIGASVSSSQVKFDADLCRELLQRLVKGKVTISNEDLQMILLLFGDPSLERTLKKYHGETTVDAADNAEACSSIWQAVQHIAYSAPGALGIPEVVEATLKWEVQKLVSGCGYMVAEKNCL